MPYKSIEEYGNYQVHLMSYGIVTAQLLSDIMDELEFNRALKQKAKQQAKTSVKILVNTINDQYNKTIIKDNGFAVRLLDYKDNDKVFQDYAKFVKENIDLSFKMMNLEQQKIQDFNLEYNNLIEKYGIE